jgi:N-acetylmuramoyl-L-alanine amidase
MSPSPHKIPAGYASRRGLRALGFAAAMMVLSYPAHSSAQQAGAPNVSAARIVLSGEMTRLAFDISARVEARAFVLADPARVIIDLPETSFAIDPPLAAARKGARSRSDGLISSYRFGRLAEGKSRIVIDLSGPARILRAASEIGPDGTARLLIDLAPTDTVSFAVAAAASRTLAASTVNPNSRPAAASAVGLPADRPLIVIDPGHGGVDVGAQLPGRPPEKDVVFEFARALARKLEAGGRYSTVLTRNEDVFVSLGERVRIARTAGAHLFVSIHADTLNEASVSGATVYTVSDRASDVHAARLAEKENLADKAAGFDTPEEASEISDILFDLTRRETRAYSHVFARTLVSIWKDAAGLNKNPQRSAGFKVLQAPDVPSVLLELGYLSSQKDAALLTTPEWREKTAGAVARSIDSFFAMRGPGRGAAEGATQGAAPTSSPGGG